MPKPVTKALKDGLVYFLAYGQFKVERPNHKMLGKVNFIADDESGDVLYMYETSKGFARVLPPSGVGKHIKVEVYEMEEDKLIELQKKLNLDVCINTTKKGYTGFTLVDRPFNNSISLQRGCVDDC